MFERARTLARRECLRLPKALAPLRHESDPQRYSSSAAVFRMRTGRSAATRYEGNPRRLSEQHPAGARVKATRWAEVGPTVTMPLQAALPLQATMPLQAALPLQA